MKKGDVQSIQKAWELAKVWYGNHLKPDWTKWSIDEAREIFKRFGFTNDIWKLPEGKSRF